MKQIFTFVFGIVLMMIFSARADLYTAESVEMSGTGNTPVEAKNNAITAGELQAFNQVIAGLVGADNEGFVERPDDNEILGMVRDISILTEKNTETTYWGKMNVRFKQEAIQNLLKKNNQTYLKKAPPIYWVIPVWHQGTETRTLEDENPFYQMLKTQNKLSDNFRMILPDGDINELITVENAFANGDFSEAQKMANLKKAERILVVEVWLKPDGTWEMQPTSYAGTENIYSNQIVQGGRSETLWQGWQNLNQKMAFVWQNKNTFDTNENNLFYARINLPQTAGWKNVETELKKLGFLENLKLQGAMPGQLLIRFEYPSSQTELVHQLEKAGWLWQEEATNLGTLKRKDFYENVL